VIFAFEQSPAGARQSPHRAGSSPFAAGRSALENKEVKVAPLTPKSSKPTRRDIATGDGTVRVSAQVARADARVGLE